MNFTYALPCQKWYPKQQWHWPDFLLVPSPSGPCLGLQATPKIDKPPMQQGAATSKKIEILAGYSDEIPTTWLFNIAMENHHF